MSGRKQNSFMVMLAMSLTGFISAVDAFTVSPILEVLNQHFSQYSYAVTSLIGTMSTVTVAIASLITTFICARYGRKRTLLTGILICSAGGTLSAVCSNFYLLLLTRLIEGFGAGLSFNTGLIMIPYVFGDEDTINKVFGRVTGISSVCGMICSLVSGSLALASWRYSFILYAFGLILFFVDLAFVPDVKENNEAGSIRPSGKGLRHAALTFVFSMVSTIYFIGSAGFIAETINGNSAQAGILSALITFVTFVMGFVFGKVFAKFRAFTPALSFLLMALGSGIPLLFRNFPMILIGAAVFAVGYGTYYPYISAEVNEISKPEEMDANMSWMNFGYYIGQIACSFLMSLIAAVTGSASAVNDYVAMLIIFAVMTVVYLIPAAGRKS